MKNKTDYLTHWTNTLASNVKELTLSELKEVTRQEELISKTYTIDLKENKPVFADLLDVLEELHDKTQAITSTAFYNTMEAIISLWAEIDVRNS